MDKNIVLNWNSAILCGNPRNQRVIASYDEERFSVSITIQDFTVPGFVKPSHIPEKMIYMSCCLKDRRNSYRNVYVFRTVGPDTPENRANTEAAYQSLIFIANKVTNKRPKESKQLLSKLAGVHLPWWA